MRIAFLGLENSFGYNNIGGIDSIVRRLAKSLVESGDKVVFINYGCAENENGCTEDKIGIFKVKSFGDALDVIKGKYDHVISIYLKPIDRLFFTQFQKSQSENMKFHSICASWNESRIRHELSFAGMRFFPSNGFIFCLSPRIHKGVSKYVGRVKLLLPPVSSDCFCNKEDKETDGILRIMYAGRIDEGKGVDEAIEVFNDLEKHSDIETRICAYVGQGDAATMEIHKNLLTNPNVTYEPVSWDKWTPSVDSRFLELLRQTDILLLPYRKLSSTVDMPLLFLEGMASLCAVISPPVGDLHDIYGDSFFNMSGVWNAESMYDKIIGARHRIKAERERLMRQNVSLEFDTESVTAKFREVLNASNK